MNSKFNEAKTTKESLLYAKLAVLELCGWIETSMDDLIIRSAKQNLQIEEHYKYIEKQIVRRNSGFQYHEHFRKMFSMVLGLHTFELIERQANMTKLLRLQSTLSNLKTMRNEQAHTYVKNATKTIDSPSVTLNNFRYVYDGLKEFERILKCYGYLRS